MLGAAGVFLAAPAHADPDPHGGLLPVLTEEQLIELATATGEVIVLEGTAPVLPTTAGERVIDERTLATTPRRAGEDVLRAVPGLYLSRHGAEGKAAQIFLRGFDAVHGSDLEVRIAGLGVNEPSNVHGHGYVDLGFVIPEVLSRVHAREGSFALDQGDFATAGSVSLELGTSRRGARTSYELGSTRRHRVLAVLAPEGRPREELVAVEAMRDAGFGDNRASERVSAVAQTRLERGRAWIEPVAFAYSARFGAPGVVPLADLERGAVAFDAAYARGTGTSQRVLGGVRAGRGRAEAGAWIGWRSLALEENFTGFLMSPEHGDAKLQTHDATSGGASATWRRAIGPRLDLVAGAEARGELLRQTEDQIDGEGRAWQRNRSLAARVWSGGVRAGLEGRWGGLRGAAGARADGLAIDARDRLMAHDGGGTAGTISPRATVAWERGRLGLFAAYGRGLRSPEARAFTAAAAEPGDPDAYTGGLPSITTSDSFETGARVALGPLALQAAGFATLIDRESLFDHASGTNLELGGTRRLGAEVAAIAQPAAWLTLRGDLTAVDARFAASGNPVPGAPRLLAQAEAHVAHGAWSGGAHVTHVGARPLAHGATGAASTVVDALVAWRRGHLEVGLQLDNVLGARWFEGEYHLASWWDRSRPRSSLPTTHYSAGRPLGARLAITMLL